MQAEMPVLDPPLGLLAELTHRCPLRCPYCSNPLELLRAGHELDTDTWVRVFTEAADLGVLQLHLSGGEPAVRQDLRALVAAASRAGLYSNLITSGLLLTETALRALAAEGLNHVQLSLQDADARAADEVAGYRGAHERKLRFAAAVRAVGLPLTVNLVVHRQNLQRLEQAIALAAALGAGRLEVAHAQYHGWALANRAALLPSRDQVQAATAIVEAARVRLRGRMSIDYVAPDYHARQPKACMGGWGRRFLAVAPDGAILPCHAAASLPGLRFPNVRTSDLRQAWEESDVFRRFRGTGWMREPCRSCARREEDWGGCRCQAYALTGDATATDPVCELSPHHARVMALAAEEPAGPPPPFRHRRPQGSRE